MATHIWNFLSASRLNDYFNKLDASKNLTKESQENINSMINFVNSSIQHRLNSGFNNNFEIKLSRINIRDSGLYFEFNLTCNGVTYPLHITFHREDLGNEMHLRFDAHTSSLLLYITLSHNIDIEDGVYREKLDIFSLNERLEPDYNPYLSDMIRGIQNNVRYNETILFIDNLIAINFFNPVNINFNIELKYIIDNCLLPVMSDCLTGLYKIAKKTIDIDKALGDELMTPGIKFNASYKQKYLKYKQKYLKLKNEYFILNNN